MAAKNTQNTQNVNDLQELDELALMNDLNAMNKILMECGHQVDEIRIQAAEMLVQMSMLNEPIVDLTRFTLLEMHDDYEVLTLKIDDPDVLAALEEEQKVEEKNDFLKEFYADMELLRNVLADAGGDLKSDVQQVRE